MGVICGQIGLLLALGQELVESVMTVTRYLPPIARHTLMSVAPDVSMHSGFLLRRVHTSGHLKPQQKGPSYSSRCWPLQTPQMRLGCRQCLPCILGVELHSQLQDCNSSLLAPAECCMGHCFNRSQAKLSLDSHHLVFDRFPGGSSTSRQPRRVRQSA